MNLEELGKRVQQKFTQYSGLDPVDVGKRVATKFPAYQALIRETEKQQGLLQERENLFDLKDALESEVKTQPTIDATKTAQEGGWIKQQPVTLEQLRAGTATSQPEVLGATTAAPSEFRNLIALAETKARARGFHPAPIVSQMAAESERGKSRFARERNNLFGIGSFDNNLDNTWKFKSPEESIDAYLNLIETDKRYAKAYAKRNNPKEYIKAIKAAGYASDPNYVQTITNTPEWREMMNK